MLIIIDLQEYYIPEFYQNEEKFDTLLKNLKRRVEEARRNREKIINLTFFEDGCTLPQVLEMTEGYEERYFLAKSEFDGSDSIHGFMRSCPSPKTEAIELTGAFRDVCVLETWKGLKDRGYKVLPVRKELSISTPTNWRGIKRYPNGYLREREGVQATNKGRITEAV